MRNDRNCFAILNTTGNRQKIATWCFDLRDLINVYTIIRTCIVEKVSELINMYTHLVYEWETSQLKNTRLDYFWGSVHHFYIYTYTIFRSQQRNTRFATKWGYIIWRSTHHFYVFPYTIFSSWQKIPDLPQNGGF